MTHPLTEVRADEKGEKRLDSLEQKAVEVENKLLYAQKIALERRVKELEASLKESNEECNKLRQTIAHMESADKNVTLSDKEEDVLIRNDDNNTDDKTDEISSSDSSLSDLPLSVNINNKEEEIIYSRILKLIENMKSDCNKAINMKIPTESQLPMRQSSIKSILSKSPSPTEGLISPTRRTPISIMTNIPTSRSGTPSPPNAFSTSPSSIPMRNPTSPNKTSHIPSRSNTPSGNHSPSNSMNSIPVAVSLNKRQLQKTVNRCSNIPSRPSTPPPSNIHNITTTGIPSCGLPRMQCRRQVAC